MNTNEQYLSGPLLWIGISLGVIFAFLFYTPFPLSIPLAITAFVLLNFHFRKKVIKRMNPMFGNSSSSYSCINCLSKMWFKDEKSRFPGSKHMLREPSTLIKLATAWLTFLPAQYTEI